MACVNRLVFFISSTSIKRSCGGYASFLPWNELDNNPLLGLETETGHIKGNLWEHNHSWFSLCGLYSLWQATTDPFLTVPVNQSVVRCVYVWVALLCEHPALIIVVYGVTVRLFAMPLRSSCLICTSICCISLRVGLIPFDKWHWIYAYALSFISLLSGNKVFRCVLLSLILLTLLLTSLYAVLLRCFTVVEV